MFKRFDTWSSDRKFSCLSARVSNAFRTELLALLVSPKATERTKPNGCVALVKVTPEPSADVKRPLAVKSSWKMWHWYKTKGWNRLHLLWSPLLLLNKFAGLSLQAMKLPTPHSSLGYSIVRESIFRFKFTVNSSSKRQLDVDKRLKNHSDPLKVSSDRAGEFLIFFFKV